MKWLYNWFMAKYFTSPKMPPIKLPIKGEIWVLIDGSPWGNKYASIDILDQQDGWVRYYINSTFYDERCTVETFLAMYKHVPSN